MPNHFRSLPNEDLLNYANYLQEAMEMAAACDDRDNLFELELDWRLVRPELEARGLIASEPEIVDFPF